MRKRVEEHLNFEALRLFLSRERKLYMQHEISLRPAGLNWKERSQDVCLCVLLQEEEEVVEPLNLHIYLCASRGEHCLSLFYSTVFIPDSTGLFGDV